MPEVILVRCTDYTRENTQAALDAILDQTDKKNLFKAGEKILLKPNLLSARPPQKAVTTHPEIVRATAAALGKYGVILSYGDSPATDSTERAAAVSGIAKVMDELSVPLADFKNSAMLEYPEGKAIKNFQFVKAVEDSDGIVNIAKFKTHALTRFTGALKNLFGLVPGLAKAKEHVRFPDELRFTDMLADMNKCLPARFHIIDAVTGMEGNGPSGGDPKDLGWIMASADPVALDSVCVSMIGIDPRGVPVITAAAQAGLGESDLKRIDLVILDEAKADPVRIRADQGMDKICVKDFKHAANGHAAINVLNTSVGTFLKRLVINRPVVTQDKCTRCKVCVEVCPLEHKAISFNEAKGRIVYDYSKCIRCFCCQELCPQGAIEVHEAPLGFLIRKPKSISKE